MKILCGKSRKKMTERKRMVDKIFSDRKYRGKIVLYVVLKFAYSGLLLLPPYCYLLFLDEIIIGQRLERQIGRAHV